MITVRFANYSDAPIDLIVEPWATTETIPPGSTFAIRYSPPRDRPDTSFAAYHADAIQFFVEGDSYELDIDGVSVPT